MLLFNCYQRVGVATFNACPILTSFLGIKNEEILRF